MADRPGAGLGAFTLHCRGGVSLFLDGADCTPKPKKGRALLAILAAEQRPLTRTRIIDLLWSDRQEEQARASLRTLLADLKAQYPERFDDLLLVERERIALAPSVRTDLADPALARPAGELFEGLDHLDPELDDWLRVERERWRAQAKERSQAAGGEPAARQAPITRTGWKWLTGALVAAAGAALIFWLAAIRGEPAGARATIDRARNLIDQRSPHKAAEARRLLIRAVQDDPHNVDALALLAEATMAMSDHPGLGGFLPHATAMREARSYGLRAIKLDPQNAAAWAALAQGHYATAQAIRPLEKAVAREPDNAQYRARLGRALEYENRYDEAILHQQKAIELDPLAPEPIMGFISAAAQLGRNADMQAQIAAYARRRPHPDHLALARGYLAFQVNDNPACTRNLEPLVRKGDYRALGTLVYCLTALGERRRAAELRKSVPSLQTDILSEDVSALERRAMSMGRGFWLRNYESLAATDLLVKYKRDKALVHSFDASYDSIAEFEQEGGRVAMEPHAILLAMRRVGRTRDGQQLRELLARQVKGWREGMGLDTWALQAKAALALADGDRDRAVALLDQCYPDCIVGIFTMDISETGYFGQLNGHPDFDRLIARYRALVNISRKKAGMRPLDPEPPISSHS